MYSVVLTMHCMLGMNVWGAIYGAQPADDRGAPMRAAASLIECCIKLPPYVEQFRFAPPAIFPSDRSTQQQPTPALSALIILNPLNLLLTCKAMLPPLRTTLRPAAASIMSMSASSSSSAIPALTSGKIIPLSRGMSSSSSVRQDGQAVKVERLTVFGAGLMGAGIAQVGAQNGLKVGF